MAHKVLLLDRRHSVKAMRLGHVKGEVGCIKQRIFYSVTVREEKVATSEAE